MKSVKILALALLVLAASCSSTTEKPAPAAQPATPAPKPDAGPLGEMAVPADNPLTPEKVELGKKLFFDTRLSKTGKMDCETCHQPDKGWTDGKVVSERFDGSPNTRHSPTLYNVGYYKQWYWDGRAATLEGQVTAAWRGQMGGDPEAVAMTLNGIDAYKADFQKVFNGPATADNIPKAIAAFVRTIKSQDSPWDKYQAGDKSAVNDDVVKGFDVFSNSDKANCTLCHLPPLFTDTLFHNVGIGFDKPMPDLGRGKILGDAAEKAGKKDPDADTMRGGFKTPTLRSITEHPPYFHDGRAKTLEDAVDLMLKGGIKNPNLDEKLKPRTLKSDERSQLMAFLKSLTPEQKNFEKPQLP
ncbi:MAG TPA: cytochrome c peroxidase [Terriglobia bacterium]|nr:cytochrome c peroxidase [Terriglobia bacterium]